MSRSEETLSIHRKLFEGVSEHNMNHLESVSSYNSNYYEYNGNLLYAKSDDDNYTAWYWIKYGRHTPVGGSFTDMGDAIIIEAIT